MTLREQVAALIENAFDEETRVALIIAVITADFERRRLLERVAQLEAEEATRKRVVAARQRARREECEDVPASLRFQILSEDGYRCTYCGRQGSDEGVALHVDHVVPRASGGTNDRKNLVTACNLCNQGKGAS